MSVALAPAAADPFFEVEKLLAAGRYREALAALEPLPVSARRHLLASKAWDGAGDARRAIEEAVAAVRLEPEKEAHHLQLGQLHLTHRAPRAALNVFGAAEERFPDSVLVRVGKGLALRELLRFDEAAEELRWVVERQPRLAVAFDALAMVYLHTSRYEDLLRLAEAFRARSPDDFRGAYYLAAAREGLRRPPSETEELAREAIRMNPKFAAAHVLLGKVLLETGRAADAIPVLEEAARLRPDYPPAHLHLSNAYRKVGRKQDAAREAAILQELNQRARSSTER